MTRCSPLSAFAASEVITTITGSERERLGEFVGDMSRSPEPLREVIRVVTAPAA